MCVILSEETALILIRRLYFHCSETPDFDSWKKRMPQNSLNFQGILRHLFSCWNVVCESGFGKAEIIFHGCVGVDLEVGAKAKGVVQRVGDCGFGIAGKVSDAGDLV